MHAAEYRVEAMPTGASRIVCTNPGSQTRLFMALLQELGDPVCLLYVLHTPRGEGAAGRYQSPWMERQAGIEFMHRFADFLESDGRFDLWAHSAEPDATLVWDRHDLLFLYGPIERFQVVLSEAGFRQGAPAVPSPHEHHYHPECDTQAAALIAALEWDVSPLAASDLQ